MLQAMKAGNELCKVLGEDALAAECEAVGNRMTKAASKVIKPFLKSGVAPDAPGSKQAASLLALAGLMKPEEADRRYLAVNGGQDSLLFMVIICFERWLLPANYQGAIDVIRQFWGAMLDLGATTFWEDFNLDWLPGASRIDELVPVGKKDIMAITGLIVIKVSAIAFVTVGLLVRLPG